MQLAWDERYHELEAVTEHGVYHIDAPDSLNQREVTFWHGPNQNFVARKLSEDEAKDAAQKHFDWLLEFFTKEKS